MVDPRGYVVMEWNKESQSGDVVFFSGGRYKDMKI